jgi:hypothetical protein
MLMKILFWSLPFRFFLSNFLILICTIYFESEFNNQPENYKGEEYLDIEYLIGGLIVMILFIGFLFLLLIAFIRFKRITNESQISFFKNGLNKLRKWYMVLYYFKFFSIRFIILILLALTPILSSTLLWKVHSSL